MNRTTGMFWLAALVFLVGAQPLRAQANGSAAARTIWDGVYTEAQAARGQRAVQQNCGSCHSPAEWSNAMFITAWSGRSIADLQSQIRTTMPFDSPGKLSSSQYSDIVAYMLKINNVPTGPSELPSEEDALQKIAVTRASGR